MSDDLFGINEEKLSDLILDIGTKEDEIGEIFNNMLDINDTITDSFSCSSSNQFKTKAKKILSNVSSLKNNYDIYKEDLTNVKNNMDSVEVKAIKTVENSIINIENITNKNINMEVK